MTIVKKKIPLKMAGTTQNTDLSQMPNKGCQLKNGHFEHMAH